MEALQELELKRNIYIQGGFMLSSDSLTGDVLNVDFEAIGCGLYEQQKRREYLNPQEQALITELKAGRKIRLGVFWKTANRKKMPFLTLSVGLRGRTPFKQILKVLNGRGKND